MDQQKAKKAKHTAILLRQRIQRVIKSITSSTGKTEQTPIGWDPYPLNQPASAHQTWYGGGKYFIRFKAKDDFGEDDYGDIGESEWSNLLVVSISKNKKSLNHVFLKDLSLIKQLLSIT